MKKTKFFGLLVAVFVAMLLPMKEATGQQATMEIGEGNPVGDVVPSGSDDATPSIPYVAIFDNGTLTFKYDENKPDGNYNSWSSFVSEIKMVVFDKSCMKYSPTSCANWFRGFDNLVEFSGFSYLNTEYVTDMSQMFYGCSSLTELNLGSFNTANVTNMEGMFDYCSNIQTIFVGDNWTTAKVTDYDAQLFIECKKLVGGKGTACIDDECQWNANMQSLGADVPLPYAHIDGGASNPGYFTRVGEQRDAYAVFENGTLTFKYDENKPEGAFGLNDPWGNIINNITRVVFDKSFAEYRPNSCMQWFSGCINLTEVIGIKENLNTEDVTNMLGMFDDCKNLLKIDLSGFNTEKVRYMSSMFRDCSNLSTLDLSSFNTANVIDMLEMFRGCGRLQSIFVGDQWTTTSVTQSESMFEGCDALYGGKGTHCEESGIKYARIDGGASLPGYLTKSGEEPFSIKVPYVILDKKTKVATLYYGNNLPVGAYSFDGRVEIKITAYSTYRMYLSNLSGKIKIDQSFAEYKPTSCAGWFAIHYPVNCEVDYDINHIREIDGLEYINTKNVTDMSEMFAGCDFTDLDLSSLNTAKVTNMDRMFEGCEKLETIYIGNKWSTSAVSSSEDMFWGCENLFGGKGTECVPGKVGHEYAKIDGGKSSPGYLSQKGNNKYVYNGAQPYATLNDNTLTFYYDNKYTTGAYKIRKFMRDYWWEWKPSWTEADFTKVVLDQSFAEYEPTILNNWFSYCEKLTDVVNLQYLNTSNVTSMRNMFRNCIGLTSLDLRSFDTENADLSDMFTDCSNLTTIYIGDKWSTKSFTGDMFSGCNSLVGGKGTKYNEKHIDDTYAHIDGGASNPGYFTKAEQESHNVAEPYAVFDNGILTFYYDGKKPKNAFEMKTSTDDEWTSIASEITKVVFDNSFADYRPTSCEYWFLYCSNLTEIEGMKNLNTENVTSIRSMFNMCEKLESIDLSGFDPQNVTNMRCTFYGCNNLKALDLSKFKTEKVTTMYSMFKYCENLTNLDLSSFNTKNVADMSCMLDSCINLKTVDLSSFNTQNVTDMHRMFAYCHNLSNVNLQGFNTANVEYMNHLFYHCNNLASLDLSKFNTEKVTNMKSMFCHCDNLKTLDLSSFNTKNVTDMSYMLDSCINLKTVDLSSFNTKNVTNMYGMFEYCNNLATIDLSNFDTKNVTNMGFMFDNCKKLQNIDLSNFDTRNVTSMRAMFQHCDNLKNLDLGGFVTKNVEDMAGMFGLCKNLVNINCSGFDTKFVTNMLNMFTECNSLAIIDLGSFNTERVANMKNMFYNCTNLTTIYVGDNWSTSSVTESKNMFSKCTSLVGGKGTAFNSDKTDKSYARIDGGNNNPGYFTKSGEKPYDVSTPVSELSVNSNIKIWSFEKNIYIDNAVANISIVDIYGRHIKTIRAISDHIEIPMIKSGVYIVKTGVATQKVIIQ